MIAWDSPQLREWLAQMPPPADHAAAAAPHAITALAYLAAGSKPAASMLGPDWRTIGIRDYIVHWHTQSGYWLIYPPAGPIGAPIAQIGILPLWMLIHGQTSREARDDISTRFHRSAA